MSRSDSSASYRQLRSQSACASLYHYLSRRVCLYQIDYLKKMADSQGLESDAAALQSIIDKAMGADSVKAAIFDTFHCVHCGSKNPAPWIADRKGKIAYPLAVSADAVTFLSGRLLLPVGPPGPNKKVQEGPRRSDPHKAARCCIDWAIKEYGPDGKSK